MKKTLAALVAFTFTLSSSVAFAQIPVGVSGITPAVSPVFEKVGVVAATQGKVKLSMPGEAGHIAESGEAVFISQEVATDAKGHLQILLLDETIFTIGPNSSITIDKFVYDPKSHDGEIRASITKGIFRYVSGKIAAKKSTNVSMKLPTATIGFRGTIVGGSVGGNGQGIVALLGPGTNNDANAQIGSFSIEGQGGDQQDVNRTGFGVEVGAGGGLSGVFQLSNEQVNNLTSGLAPSGNSGQGGGQGGGTGGQTGGGGGQGGGLLGSGNMSNLSGETGAITGENSSLTGALNNLTGNLDNASTQAAQDAAATSDKVANGATTYEQLSRITTGFGHYDFSGDFKNTYGTVVGTLSARCVIDFGNQRIGGGNSFMKITSGAYSVSTNGLDDSKTKFSDLSNGVVQWTDGEAMQAGNPYPVGTFNTISLALNNNNGVVAQQGTASVTFTDGGAGGSSGISSGSGTSGTALLQSGS